MTNKWFIGAAVAALVLGVIYMKRPNKNVRNNNPLNIESRDDWNGLAEVQSDSRFAVFVSPEYGFRAGYIILLKYLERGDNTINKIVAKWAPSFENHVEVYAGYVAEKMDKSADDLILPDDLASLMLHMSNFEGAKGAYNIDIANQGIELAKQSDFVVARLGRIDESTSWLDKIW